MLSDEEKQLADHSWVEYAPHPYMWIENCKAPSNGLGLKCQGKEHTLEELGDYDEKDIKRVEFPPPLNIPLLTSPRARDHLTDGDHPSTPASGSTP